MGDAFDAIEEDYRIFSRQRELARHLPGVWDKILEGKNQILLQTVIDEMKKVCRYIPTEEEVLAFLKNFNVRPSRRPCSANSHFVPSVSSRFTTEKITAMDKTRCYNARW